MQEEGETKMWSFQQKAHKWRQTHTKRVNKGKKLLHKSNICAVLGRKQNSPLFCRIYTRKIRNGNTH